MIIKNIPVEEKHKPEYLGIYWAVPWEVKIDRIVSFLSRNDDITREIEKQFKTEFYRRGRTPKSKMIYDFVHENLDKVVAFMSTCDKELFVGNDLVGYWGMEDNPSMKLRVMIGEEPVGVLSYEYSILSAENMNLYLEEKCHELVPQSNIASEIIELTKRQGFIKDAARLDGCTDHQADMIAIGKDPEIDFPPPLGWYQASQEVKAYF